MPKFKPEAISIILLGPGVTAAEIANSNIGNINSIITSTVGVVGIGNALTLLYQAELTQCIGRLLATDKCVDIILKLHIVTIHT